MLESFFNKVAGAQTYNVIKKPSTQLFPCKISELFKNTLKTSTLKNICEGTASENSYCIFKILKKYL